MKKILFIHHWNSIGGSGISFFNTWKALENKYDIISYIPSNPPSLLNFLKSKGLTPKTYSFVCGQIPYYSGGSNLLKPGFWYLTINAALQMHFWKKVILEEKPDLIMVNSKVLCWMGVLFKNYKSVCFVRETIKGKPGSYINRIMKKMLEKFTVVSFLSKYDLVQTNLIKAKSIVAPDFLYLDEYEDKLGRITACNQLNVNPNSFNIAFVGGIDRLKGIDIVVKAMNLLKNENITFIIAGNDAGSTDGSGTKSIFNRIIKRKHLNFSRRILDYIKDNDLEKNIRFVGIQKDISLVFSASDALVFPMKEPHQARPAFEIGTQKKPVIISDFHNISEFVQDGVNGLTFEQNNAKSLAQAIIKLKNDPDLCRRLGDFNYEYTTKYHTEKYVSDTLIKNIDKILY